jgi:hypothetical protein
MEFNDWDEAMAFMQKQEEEANASLTDKQREIVYGSYWIRPFDGHLEYGHVLPEGSGGTADTYARGYRYSECHSILGDGMGDVHLAVIWPILEEEYRSAEANLWAPSNEPWEQDMLIRIVQEHEEANTRPPNPGSPQEGS